MIISSSFCPATAATSRTFGQAHNPSHVCGLVTTFTAGSRSMRGFPELWDGGACAGGQETTHRSRIVRTRSPIAMAPRYGALRPAHNCEPSITWSVMTTICHSFSTTAKIHRPATRPAQCRHRWRCSRVLGRRASRPKSDWPGRTPAS